MVDKGPAAFYKGMSRVVWDSAITSMIYDSFMELFNKAFSSCLLPLGSIIWGGA